jgi:hypothetical protein
MPSKRELHEVIDISVAARLNRDRIDLRYTLTSASEPELLILIAEAAKELLSRESRDHDGSPAIAAKVNATRRRMATNLRDRRRTGQEYKVTVF